MKRVLSIFFLIVACSSVQAQSDAKLALNKADSLFEAKKYTESFEIYNHLLKKQKRSSSAMLLRMAFIKEGLGDFSNALYYLNIYHLKTSDPKALNKMEGLAEKKELSGYGLNDWDFGKSIIYKYYNYIVYFLLALSIFLFASVYQQHYKKKASALVPGIIMVVVLGVLFYVLNFGRNYDKAIVSDSNTYLMSGPSAGAEVIDIISKGHRLTYGDRQDVWVEVSWNDAPAYVKSNKLKYVQF